MAISAFSHRLSEQLVEFAWDEWAQMGLLATPHRRSPWAQDPEALIIFTLEVARADPRLFDELLDWMLVNEPLLSVRRLRAMCIDDVLALIQVEGTEATDDLLGDHVHQRLASASVGVNRRAPQDDPVLGAQDLTIGLS